MTLLVGIFVGGRGSRLGGVAKGLLRAPDGELTLVERLVREVRLAAPSASVVLVGASEPYERLGLTMIADAPAGVGPLGGLLGLLRRAEQQGDEQALALACDLPRLDHSTIRSLLDDAPDEGAIAVEQEGVRNPLVARYHVARALRAAELVLESGRRSLQAVLDVLDATTLALPLDSRVADDWDTPSDVSR